MAATQQPDYKLVGTIGDVDPIAYGGGFVYIDQTGVYPAHLEYIEPGETEDKPVTIYRLDLDPPRFKTNGPQPIWDRENFGKPEDRGTAWVWHREWFAEADRVTSVAESCGQTPFSLLRELASKDPMTRARAYESLIGHFGPFEFDQYPLTMPEYEARNRYAKELGLKPVAEVSVDTIDQEYEEGEEETPTVYALFSDRETHVEITDDDDLIAAAQMFAEYEVDSVEKARICLNYHVAYGGTAKDLKRRFFY